MPLFGFGRKKKQQGLPEGLRENITMDTYDMLPIMKAVLPKVPTLGRAALWHTLGMTETSKHWDLKTALIITTIRSFVIHDGPGKVHENQKLSLRDPGIKGKMWVSNVTLPKPSEDDIRNATIEAVDSLAEPNAFYNKPDLKECTAEWTGFRSDAHKNSPRPEMPEEQHYTEMMKEVTSPTTTLYFHGGAHYLMDPCSHRLATSKLARLTKGRVLSVRYRLAPQNPFPASLVDALLSYLYLLYPPPGSLHTPIEAKHIVFAGDSAGGNLSTSLLLLILTLQRMNRKVTFNGQEIAVPLPGGVALNSPWMDITGSCPSQIKYAGYDYLPGAHSHPDGMEFIKDDIWPTNPPRKNLFADNDVILHPFVSPLAAPVEMWKGSCPVWYCTGWELLNDEDRAVAKKMHDAGVTVQFEEFEGMPHCFAMLLEGTPGSRRCYKGWAEFISAVTTMPEGVKSRAIAIAAKTLKERELEWNTLCEFDHETALKRMRDRKAHMDSKHPDTLSKL